LLVCTFIYFESVSSDPLKNAKLNGGSNMAVVGTKTTLAGVCEFTLTFNILGIGPSLSEKPNSI
jgi:hypothetical protein